MSRCVDEDFAAISEMKQREDNEEEKFQVSCINSPPSKEGMLYIHIFVLSLFHSE